MKNRELGSKKLWNQEEKSRTLKGIGVGSFYSLISENRQRVKDLQTASFMCGNEDLWELSATLFLRNLWDTNTDVKFYSCNIS